MNGPAAKDMRKALEVMEMWKCSVSRLLVVISQACTSVKTHHIARFKGMHFAVHKFYFVNKILFKLSDKLPSGGFLRGHISSET